EISNSPASSARSAPSRTTAASPRPPTSNSMASTRIDLPAPVSPVRTVKPSASSSEAWSIRTKSRTSSARSTNYSCLVTTSPLRRERIGRGAGRRGDDHAVGAQRIDEFTVERQIELNETSLRAFADHRFVERERAQHRFAPADDLGVEHRAVLDRVLALEDRSDARLHVAVTDVGHEADAPQVDADHRNAVAHEIARRGEQRAVAADDDREIGRSADRGVIEAALADHGRGFFLEEDFAAALAEKCDQLTQRCRDLRAAELADQSNAAEARFAGGRRHCVECTMNPMLDKRAQILLKTLIERYIAEGQPVGSRTLSKYSGLDLS